MPWHNSNTKARYELFRRSALKRAPGPGLGDECSDNKNREKESRNCEGGSLDVTVLSPSFVAEARDS